MRTVLVHIWNTPKSTLTAALDAMYPGQRNPWIARVDQDPCLYIDIYRHGPFDLPDWKTRFSGVGGQPTVSISADISGRHNGWPQVAALMEMLLARFQGFAEDDSSDRLWSLAELLRGDAVGNVRFGERWRDWGTL